MQHATTPATPDPALAIGTTHQGFSVTAIEAVPEIGGIAYVMRHDASSARLLWLANDDVNRSFAIAFKTPPADDTGVFHILEHSVLCGSERFPVKEPFVNLLKSSMQTFLNALTFPDKTMYPVSSTNVTDLENLMDVYLDATLNPAIYLRRHIFEQEGWHYEYDAEADRLTYNGVVFNEMKGALSDPDEVAFLHASRALFPDTPYRFESGGDPRAIPTLTYERFLDHHARHYNLANSYTILYGDLDIERELAFVGARFDAARDRGAGAPNPLPLQAPVVAPLVQVPMATAPENALVMLGYVAGTSADRERMLAIDLLLDAIAGSNEAPLKRAVLDADLGDDLQVSLVDGVLQPQILFVLKGAKPDAAERFRTLVEETCACLAAEGIGAKRLSASLSRGEFNLRENDSSGSASDGISYAMLALGSWLYDDDRPVDYLRYEDALARLHEGLDQGYFEALLDEVVCQSAHRCAIELVPTETGNAAEELAELAERRRALSDEELAAIVANVDALRAEQERPDAPEDLAKLPRLALSDIGDAPHETRERFVDAPLPCIAHDLPTHGIVYTYHYFDLRRLGFEDLHLAGLLSDVLGKLGTERLSAAELDTEIEEQLGSLIYLIETYGSDDDPTYLRPIMLVGASALSDHIEALATLPAEVWGQTRFDDLEQIHDILLQRRLLMEQRFTNAGHASAMGRLSTYFRPSSIVSDETNGLGYYQYLKDLLAHWDERASELPAQLQALAARIFSADEVVVSVTSSPEDRARLWEVAGTYGLPTLGAEACAHRLETPTPTPRNEAFVVPSNVCFVAEGQDERVLRIASEGSHGLWTVAARALSYDYLWNEVRVKGGAYGVGFRRTSMGLEQFWSYRDPAVRPTVARFEDAAAWLAAWDPSDDEFAGYVVSSVASHDAPLKPRRQARLQDGLYFSSRPADWRDQLRRQLLEASVDGIRALAPALTELPEHRAFCVFGGREQIEAAGLDLEVIDLMG